MAGQHNHRKHTPYYRLQEHHVVRPKPFLLISTHDFIRPHLIMPPPSSFCGLFTSSSSFCYPFISLWFLYIHLNQPEFFRLHFSCPRLLCQTCPQLYIVISHCCYSEHYLSLPMKTVNRNDMCAELLLILLPSLSTQLSWQLNLWPERRQGEITRATLTYSNAVRLPTALAFGYVTSFSP